MAGLRQLGQNLLLTKEDGTVITKVVKDKEERERIKKDFSEKGINSVLEIFEVNKHEKKPFVEKPVEKPVQKVEKKVSGGYSGSER